MSQKKTRYAHVGLGGRSQMFFNAITETYKDSSELVAICDNNKGRVMLRQKQALERGFEVKTYLADQFDQMIRDCKPDCVIVTTKDCMHDYYICRAMELGCDAITEKPMTTDEKKCQRIIDTQRKTGKHCRVTFNYRYAPPRTQIKELLMSGVIGDVLSVDFQWMLNTHHGADYYRRWHRNKENSGGLFVHKATHHFDLVNWWLSTIPVSVYAQGALKFYTPQTAKRYGLINRGKRCLGCPDADKCAFYMDIEGGRELKELYRDCEEYDGYFRDGCVFSDTIDIEDSMQAIVTYKNGVTMSYSLNSFLPWEGFMITFSGSKGRLEHKCQESVYINGDGTVPGELVADGTYTRIFPHFNTAYEVDVWTAKGGHGGGDDPLLEDIFSPNPKEDKYLRAADQRAGAYSILCGVAANRSMESGKTILIDDLVKKIGMPDYPKMPTARRRIKMQKPTVKIVGVHHALQLQKEQLEEFAAA